MTEKDDTELDDGPPLSPAMRSALGAVARMKGESAIAWVEVMHEPVRDDRHASGPSLVEHDDMRGSYPFQE